MPLPRDQNKSKDALSSSDVKVYGYHSYNINRNPSMTRQEFVVKALIFMSLIGIWQIRMFSNTDDLKKNLRNEVLEQEYIAESIGQLGDIPSLESNGIKDDSFDITRTALYDVEWETGSPPIMSKAGEVIADKEIDMDIEEGEEEPTTEEQVDDEEGMVAAGSRDSDTEKVNSSSSLSSETQGIEETDDPDNETVNPPSSLSSETQTGEETDDPNSGIIDPSSSLSSETQTGEETDGTDSDTANSSSSLSSETQTGDETDDPVSGTINPSSPLSSDTGANEEPEQSNSVTLNSATNSTNASSEIPTASLSNETESIPSTATSNQTTVEILTYSTNQIQKESPDGLNSFFADPLVTNTEVAGPVNSGIEIVTAVEQLESSNTTNTSLTALSKNIDEPKLSNTTGTNTAGQTNATDGTILTAPSITTVEGNSPEEQQVALWKAAKNEVDAIQPWKNESTFTTVDRGDYKQVVEKAHASVVPLVEDVYTGCEMHILPALQGSVEDVKWIRKPRVKFKCLHDDDPILTDNLCHTVNMCRVVLDEEAWKEEISSFNSSMTNTNTSNASSSNINNKSTLLMMVDGIEYMTRNDIFMATINKASYAYRSNRELFVWIGNLDKTELDRREMDSLESTFDFMCAEKKLGNSMHYYKPIAILVLFKMLDNESIFFMDADTDFSPLAFDRIENDKKFDGVMRSEALDSLDPIGPESYLDISSQASLVGTQNTKGKMLMNSGLLVLRNTQWSRDLAALWWYVRCGSKDQLGLWLVLYATFSAWTMPAGDGSPAATKDKTDEPTQFAYSGKIFFDYSTATTKLFMHFRRYGHNLQAAWEAVVERQQTQSNGVETDNNSNYDYPIPTNIKLYNGGSAEGIAPRLTAVMELPHVIILPQVPVHFNTTIPTAAEEGKSATVQVNLPRFKSMEERNSFVSHSKSLKSCTEGRCWPYAEL